MKNLILFRECLQMCSSDSIIHVRPISQRRKASTFTTPLTGKGMVAPTKDPLHRFFSLSKQCQQTPKILITGGMGQLGRSLASILKYMYGRDSVLLTDICKRPADFHDSTSSYCYLNILDRKSIEEVVVNNNIDTLIHFSALLSAVGEQNVELALDVNCQGVQNVMNVAKTHKLKVFVPSTIGAFGQTTPRTMTPDLTIQRPRTIYGVTKVFAELLGEYYFERFGVDFRSLRFPGIISDVQPGGGTTDYAIQMFYDAIMYGKHTCYLRADTMLPMMYDTDCMASVINLLLAPSENLSLRTYNVTGFSFTPEQLANGIRDYFPNFEIDYKICPVRQRIADSWPRSLDDSTAHTDWNWSPEFNLEGTIRIMLDRVCAKLKPNETATTASLVASM
ncbi:NAD dependent epimerase/dehydratase family domain-containing protein [Ditylenchus destructor]|nr:NAD dependent epimerase/dehydratase family domain-containing protein [Ditylenchus destructor]